MKIGAESRAKLIAAITLGVLAVVLVANWLFGGSGSSAPRAAVAKQPGAATAAARPATRRVAASGKNARFSNPRLDPTLQLDLLKSSEDTKYEGSGKNIFVAGAEPIPQPKAPAQTDDAHKVETPPAPPPLPPINLKFFGFASKPGEPKKVFLSQGEDVFIAGEGEIVDRRYRILHIGPASVEIEDVLNNNRQSIPLTQG